MNRHHRPGCGYSPDHAGVCRSVKGEPTNEAARMAAERARQRVILLSLDVPSQVAASMARYAASVDPYAALTALTMSNRPPREIRSPVYMHTLLTNHGFDLEETQ